MQYQSKVCKYIQDFHDIISGCKQGLYGESALGRRISKIIEKNCNVIPKLQLQRIFYHQIMCSGICICHIFTIKDKQKSRNENKRILQNFIKPKQKSEYRRQYNNLLKSKLQLKKNATRGQLEMLATISELIDKLREKLKKKTYFHSNQLWRNAYYHQVLQSAGLKQKQFDYKQYRRARKKLMQLRDKQKNYNLSYKKGLFQQSPRKNDIRKKKPFSSMTSLTMLSPNMKMSKMKSLFI